MLMTTNLLVADSAYVVFPPSRSLELTRTSLKTTMEPELQQVSLTLPSMLLPRRPVEIWEAARRAVTPNLRLGPRTV